MYGHPYERPNYQSLCSLCMRAACCLGSRARVCWKCAVFITRKRNRSSRKQSAVGQSGETKSLFPAWFKSKREMRFWSRGSEYSWVMILINQPKRRRGQFHGASPQASPAGAGGLRSGRLTCPRCWTPQKKTRRPRKTLLRLLRERESESGMVSLFALIFSPWAW
jgi:hypothetical protein